jgi:N-acetylmuramoyl-L-alanine amidase
MTTGVQQFHPSIPLYLSPNRHPRNVARHPEWRATVLHFTASRPGTRGDIAWLTNPNARVSAHFLLAADGAKTQHVPLTDCAWHAGISQLVLPGGQVMRGCNDFALGIELDNLGPLVRDEETGGWLYEEGNALKPYVGATPVEAELLWPGTGVGFKAGWEPFTDIQLASLAQLLGWLADAGMRDAVHTLIGHEEIALPPGRKRDPGPAFPWARFARRLPRLTDTRLESAKA